MAWLTDAAEQSPVPKVMAQKATAHDHYIDHVLTRIPVVPLRQ